jgi:hypothetical protein
MDRHRQYVAPFPEHRLGPIAVVGVNIDDCHPPAGKRQPVGGDGTVVEVAVAAVRLRGGVMPRRPAQGVGAELPADDRIGSRGRARCGRKRRHPRSGQDRVDIVGEAAHLGEDAFRFLPRRARQRSDVGHRLGVLGAAGDLTPAGVGMLEERQKAFGVHGQQQVPVERRGLTHLEAIGGIESRQDAVGAFGHLGWRQHGPPEAVGFRRVVQTVRRMGKDDHGWLLSSVGAPRDVIARGIGPIAVARLLWF